MTPRHTAPSPPAAALAWLARRLPIDQRDMIVGDLVELFADRVDAGRRANRLWFWIQALAIVAGFAAAPGLDRSFNRRRLLMLGAGRLATGLRQATRRLAYEWRYAAAVVLVLGVGIGPAAAMLTVVQTVLLQPLPYAAPDRLGFVRLNLGQIQNHPGLSQSEVADFRKTEGLFEAVEATSRPFEVSLGPADALAPLSAINITPGLLPMLGVSPIRGRVFSDADAALDVPPAILDYGTWQSKFGGAEDIVGRRVPINGRSTEIAGVLPRGFSLTTGRAIPQPFDVYLPLRLRDSRDFWAFPTIVRLAAGTTFAQAAAGLDTLADSLTKQYPKDYGDAHLHFALSPLLDDVVNGTRPALRAAMAGVLLLLLIAVANATALVVARLRSRERDLAIRSAMGAGRGALALEVVMESAVLSAAGAVVGAALAAIGIAAARALVPHTVPRWEQIGFGWRFVAYSAGFSLAGLVTAGLVPIWRSGRGAPWQVLRGGSAQGGRADGAASRLLLVGAQIALTVVLAFGAVQLARSASRLTRVDVGFEPEVLAFRVPIDFRTYGKPADQVAVYQRVRDRLREIPGVEAVGASSHLPLSGASLTDAWTADLSKQAGYDQATANYYSVEPGYFATMRIPILQGRDFTDVEDRTAQPVVVVDEALARAAFPGVPDVLGRTLRLGWGIPDSRIVGIVGHVRATDVGRAGLPQIYAPYGSFPFPPLSFTVRAGTNPAALIEAITVAVREVGTGRAISGFTILGDNIAAATSTLRSVTSLVVSLAISAGLLSAIGLYSVIAFLVHQRRRSTAIRCALGASPGQIVRHHLRVSGLVMLVALPLGLVFAAAGAPLFGSLVYGVAPRDLTSLSVAAALAALVGGLGTYVPVRRAGRIDPVTALRSD